MLQEVMFSMNWSSILVDPHPFMYMIVYTWKLFYTMQSRLLCIMPLSLYCLVDEVLRRSEIMPDKEKNWHFIIYFFLWNAQKVIFQHGVVHGVVKRYGQGWWSNPHGTKHPCRSSSTKQYTESGVKRKCEENETTYHYWITWLKTSQQNPSKNWQNQCFKCHKFVHMCSSVPHTWAHVRCSTKHFYLAD